jgi:hypothetical protein
MSGGTSTVTAFPLTLKEMAMDESLRGIGILLVKL